MNVRRTQNPWFVAAAVVLLGCLILALVGQGILKATPLEVGVLGGGALYAIGSS